MTIIEIRFSRYLINADHDHDAKEKLYWGTPFHQFIISMITNQPLNYYGVTDRERAQIILWSSQFVNRQPLNFINADGNHYIVLLPFYDDTMLNQRYTYHCRMRYDVEYQAFRD
jgi:hypothetical protein